MGLKPFTVLAVLLLLPPFTVLAVLLRLPPFTVLGVLLHLPPFTGSDECATLTKYPCLLSFVVMTLQMVVKLSFLYAVNAPNTLLLCVIHRTARVDL